MDEFIKKELASNSMGQSPIPYFIKLALSKIREYYDVKTNLWSRKWANIIGNYFSGKNPDAGILI